MPQLVKLQEELRDSGLIIIGTHRQDGTKEEVVGLVRSMKVNYTITSGGSVPDDNVNSIPRAFLFDGTGKLIEKGHPTDGKFLTKLRELVQTEPHWLAAGRKYTKLQPVADSLKKSKTYGAILKKLEKDVNGTGPVSEEAKYLSERIRGYGERRLKEAKALETEDAVAAQQAYTEIATQWKGDKVATDATTRTKELKSDKDFQNELKACAILRQITAECDKLVIQQGKMNPENPANKKVAATVKALIDMLKKKHPDSHASAKVSEIVSAYGLKV
jgi:hypothetical protein